MNFGEALQGAKAGKKIAREGWNGKNMFVFFGLPRIEFNPPEGGAAVDAASYYNILYQSTGALAMKTAQDTIQVGWLASQSDMLADDWQIVD